MKPDMTTFLGRRILVTVDRPMGSRHPRHADILCPINYGFVPGTVSGDGMPVDAYLLDVDEAVERAEGVVIALIVRADGGEDKLVVAPTGIRYTVEQITEQVEFQERFLDSRVVLSEADPNE